MNRDRLIADAKARVLDLALDYVAPAPRTITALGKDAFGNLLYAGWAMKEGGQITDHEVRIARELNREVASGDEARRIYRIGESYRNTDETLAQLGLSPNRTRGQRGVPMRLAA